MKIDLAKTNGTSPPTNFLTPSQPQTITARGSEQIWTVAEVADYLKMSPRQVLELTRRRSQERSECPLPCFKIHSNVCASVRTMSKGGCKYWPRKRGPNDSHYH
jgi:hypothetical protein